MPARFIYFVKPVAMDGPVKIGCTVEPKERLAALLVWCPFELEILATAPGGYAEEKRLHQMFAADLLRAEWFRTTRELLAVIEGVRRTGKLPFEAIGEIRVACGGLPAILARHGITHDEFAARAGVQPVCVYQWSTQRSRSASGRVIATLETFDVEFSLDELIGDHAPAPSEAA